ncbi:MAG: site-2 protease family protein [Bacillota bacterium]
MTYIMMFLVSFPGLLIATTVHEFTRAAVSNALGDTLPKSQGRLTLNPIKHFEPIGFLLLFYSGGFGWGKPVETNSIRYKDRKRDTLLVAILPSVANLLVAFVTAGIFAMFPSSTLFGTFLSYTALYNVGLAVYNILPVSPMDCTKVLSVTLPSNQYFKYLQNEKMIQMVFLFLLFFGMFQGIFGTVINLILTLFSGFFVLFI